MYPQEVFWLAIFSKSLSVSSSFVLYLTPYCEKKFLRLRLWGHQVHYSA